MDVPEDSRPPLQVPAGLAGSGAGHDSGDGTRWRVEVVDEVASTNAAVAERFAAGETEGLVLAAELQTAGRGRLDREWVAPARSSLTVSFLLVPDGAAPERWPWLPLLAGTAAAVAVRRVTGAEVALKWPNDVLAEDRKLGGLLLERVGRGADAAAVVGIGLNCDQAQEELPVPDATSLRLVTGAPVDRTVLLGALVEELAARYDEWRAGGDVRDAYLGLCSTVGRQVRVAVPGGEVVGEAVDVDATGRLVVRTAAGEERLAAGDVVHVRPE